MCGINGIVDLSLDACEGLSHKLNLMNQVIRHRGPDATKVFTEGDIVLIPSNHLHGGKALTPCKLMDVFSPVREEYK